jgi:hypothetical protein
VALTVAAVDQLQQLRDIHLPETPGWWPPAPGWWLVAAALLVGVAWLVWRVVQRRRRGRPLRWARSAYENIHRRYAGGEIGARAYLDETNELIKRALIHGLGDDAARPASGEDWLALLDAYAGEPAFTTGPGRALGDDRFRPDLTAQPEALHPLVERLLGQLRAPPSASGQPEHRSIPAREEAPG